MQTRRLYLDAVDAVFARISSAGVVDWYLTDRLGSVRDIMDNNGLFRDHIDYWVFGGIQNETTPTYGDRYKFTSREWDSDIGWQYNRRRFHDPKTARWNGEDPIRWKAGDANLYRYVFNTPTEYTDPSGELIFIPFLIAGIIVWGAGMAGLDHATREHRAAQQILAKPLNQRTPEDAANFERHIRRANAFATVGQIYGELGIALVAGPVLGAAGSGLARLPGMGRVAGVLARSPVLGNSVLGAADGLATDFLLQTGFVVGGLQDEYDVGRLALAGAGGGLIGAGTTLVGRGARALWQRWGKNAPASQPQTLTHRNGIFEVLAEQPISGTTRSAHRAAANRGLLQRLEANPQLNRQLSKLLGVEDVAVHMGSGRSALRNPLGTEWHHPIENADVIMLLRRQVHRNPDLQGILHPGNIGGFGTHYGN